jgi:hypothetical protein
MYHFACLSAVISILFIVFFCFWFIVNKAIISSCLLLSPPICCDQKLLPTRSYCFHVLKKAIASVHRMTMQSPKSLWEEGRPGRISGNQVADSHPQAYKEPSRINSWHWQQPQRYQCSWLQCATLSTIYDLRLRIINEFAGDWEWSISAT